VAALHDYAFIADGERGALVGPHGELAWMCFPGWADGSIFSGLHVGPGRYLVTPEGPSVWGGYYEDGTLIWRSRWATEGGICECHEALSRPALRDRAVILRRVHAVEHESTFRVELELRPAYGQAQIPLHEVSKGVLEGRGGGVYARWSGAAGARPLGEGRWLSLRVSSGETHDLILELSREPFRDPPPDAEALWAQTRRSWREDVPEFPELHATREARLAAAVLHGLTTHGGGMVAAATTSLPERADRGRNYDYRFCWIRDQCYAGHAAAAGKLWRLLDDSVSFVSERLHHDGPDLRPVYTSEGRPIPREQALALRGYPGSGEIRRGNQAGRQFQLDCFGEGLLLLARAAELDRLDGHGAKAAELAAQAIARRWTEPDAGVWEVTDQHYTHSRLICAAGLRAWARARGRSRSSSRHLALADKLVARARAQCTRDDGAWKRAEGDVRTDAALLVPAFRGAFAGDEPRTAATLAAVERELMREGYVYRFRHDEHPLGHAEGAFLLCQFWLALAYQQLGNPMRALQAFERGRAATGSPGLYAEEYDVSQRQQRGNLPQAFVHAAMLECALALEAPSQSP